MTMRHEDYREFLSALRDGELAAGAQAEVQAHAASCAACSRTLADFERLSKALLRVPADSEAFVASVMARLPETVDAAAAPGAEIGFGNWRSWVTPALGFAFAAVLLVYSRPDSDADLFTDEMISAYSVPSLSNWSFPGTSAVAEAPNAAEPSEGTL